MDDLSNVAASMGLDDFKVADNDVIQPFQLEVSALRGRAVRMGDVINDILEPHGYPNPVAHLVGETITIAALLSSMLKYEGIFTLQMHGDGPVSMLVADVTAAGEVRGCASYDEERLQQAREQISALKAPEGSQNHLAQYLGKGRLVFTVDPGEGGDRYQGIVEIKGASLVDCVQHYFTQSEQIGNGIKLAVGLRDGKWRAGGVMLQHLPEDQKNAELGTGNTREDDWRRAMILMDTCTEDEMLSPDLHSNVLLTRLFHEEGVRVFDAVAVKKGCRCHTEKVMNILCTMPDDDLDHMADDGAISMHCEFCSRDFVFDLKDIRATIKDKNAETSP